MSDPNAIYKAGFRALADKLGRPPTTRDEGWLELHNEYSRSYGEERDIRVAEERKARAAGPGDMGFSRQPAPQARTYTREGQDDGAGAPLSGPGITAEGPGAVSAPTPVQTPPRVSEGARGPGGGIMAACRKCGAEFERPARVGRPPVICEGCK